MDNGGPATISDNATYCNSVEEVEAACELVNDISSINKDFEYTIYPNPANDELNIDAPFKNKTSGTLSVFNIIGHSLYQYNFNEDSIDHQIDVSAYSPGVYMLEIRTDTGRIVEKVMVIE